MGQKEAGLNEARAGTADAGGTKMPASPEGSSGGVMALQRCTQLGRVAVTLPFHWMKPVLGKTCHLFSWEISQRGMAKTHLLAAS